MKKTLLTLILLCCCLAGFADKPVEVVVMMKTHYDRTQLCRNAEMIPTRAARRDYVVSELKAFAEASQADLCAELTEWERQGRVTSVHSLIRPDVCAPGVTIWSLNYNSINDYTFMSGTSQATPCVAGIVALMLCNDWPDRTKPQPRDLSLANHQEQSSENTKNRHPLMSLK